MYVRVPRTAGFAHVSCLAEEADFLRGGRENNLDGKVLNPSLLWDKVCASKSTMASFAPSGGRAGRRRGRPEADWLGPGDDLLGNGLHGQATRTRCWCKRPSCLCGANW